MVHRRPYPALPDYQDGGRLPLDPAATRQIARWVDRFIRAEQRLRGVTDVAQRAEDEETAKSAARDIARRLAAEWGADTAP